jgi:C-terminal processing protease CtpA/Prc
MTMKRPIALLTSILALGAGAAQAGDAEKKAEAKYKKKCSAETTTCARQMAEALKKKGWVGIEWNREGDPPRITHVVEDSPAEQAGVRVGDEVRAFGGTAIGEEDKAVWAELKRSMVPGRVITLSLVRDGNALELPVELIAVPEHIIAQWVGKHVLDYHGASPEGESPASP